MRTYSIYNMSVEQPFGEKVPGDSAVLQHAKPHGERRGMENGIELENLGKGVRGVYYKLGFFKDRIFEVVLVEDTAKLAYAFNEVTYRMVGEKMLYSPIYMQENSRGYWPINSILGTEEEVREWCRVRNEENGITPEWADAIYHSSVGAAIRDRAGNDTLRTVLDILNEIVPMAYPTLAGIDDVPEAEMPDDNLRDIQAFLEDAAAGLTREPEDLAWLDAVYPMIARLA